MKYKHGFHPFNKLMNRYFSAVSIHSGACTDTNKLTYTSIQCSKRTHTHAHREKAIAAGRTLNLQKFNIFFKTYTMGYFKFQCNGLGEFCLVFSGSSPSLFVFVMQR